MTSFFLNALPFDHRRALVDTGALVRALVLRRVSVYFSALLRTYDLAAGHGEHLAIFFGDDHLSRVTAAWYSMPVETWGTSGRSRAQPGPACSSPSRRGWRHRAPGRGSAQR
jgi:hypothetical protein